MPCKKRGYTYARLSLKASFSFCEHCGKPIKDLSTACFWPAYISSLTFCKQATLELRQYAKRLGIVWLAFFAVLSGPIAYQTFDPMQQVCCSDGIAWLLEGAQYIICRSMSSGSSSICVS